MTVKSNHRFRSLNKLRHYLHKKTTINTAVIIHEQLLFSRTTSTGEMSFHTFSRVLKWTRSANEWESYQNILLYGQNEGTKPKGRPRKKLDWQHPRRLLGDGTFTDGGGQTCTWLEQMEICCTDVGLPAHVDYVFVNKAFSQR